MKIAADAKKIKMLTIRNKSKQPINLITGTGIRIVKPGAVVDLYEPVARSYLRGHPDVWEVAGESPAKDPKPDEPTPPEKPEESESKPAPQKEQPKKADKKGRTK